MESKKFVIQPKGMINAGTFEYSYDPDKKLLSYKLDGSAEMFGHREIHEKGAQSIAPEQLQSDRFDSVGAPISFAMLSGRVTAVEGKMAIAELECEVAGVSVTGTGVFDVSGKYVVLNNLHAVGRKWFMTAELILVPAASALSKNHTKV